MELLISASFIASFFAGVAALFAPCCVTVLLPTYFASIFKQRATVFLMTFIYFLGLLVVFLPIGLGASAITQLFSTYHEVIFSLGSLFLIILGLTLVSGIQFSFPVLVHPQLKNSGLGSVFVLGIFSGIATTCCAPVLAGVLALSVLPGSIIWGLAYTLAYVLGMVSPLFVFALMIDSSKLVQRLMEATQPSALRIFGRTIAIGIAELVAGVTFLIVGVLTVVWAFMNETARHSDLQVDINITLAKFQQWLGGNIGAVPWFVWVLLVLGIVAFIVRIAARQFAQENSLPTSHCHEENK